MDCPFIRIFRDFNPRIPRGMRRNSRVNQVTRLRISIHASREGCDDAEACRHIHHTGYSISIHASREGCDQSTTSSTNSISNFNPRIPRGMRHKIYHTTVIHDKISIHASREGCDHSFQINEYARNDFNPRIPRGMRPFGLSSIGAVTFISIHASREGCDHATTCD